MAINKFVCTQCEYIGNSKNAVKGNILLELILWLLFIVPGLIYSVWRLSSKSNVCPKCGSQNLVPLDSPKGQKIAKAELSEEEIDKMNKKQEDDKKEEIKTRKIIMIGFGIVLAFVLLIVILSELAY
jgi:hypothetical protein